MPTATNRIEVTTTAPAPQQPRGFAARASRWIHAHPDANQKFVGYGVYQAVRGVLSAIPYGISMAVTLGGMVGLERMGDKLAKSAAENSMKAGFGQRLAQFAKFPAIRSSMMIATSFTLYRGTGKLVKWANESLFDKKDSEAQTAEKIRHLPGDTWRKLKENAPAGISSTPVAAFVLGFVTNTFGRNKDAVNSKGQKLDWTHENFKTALKEERALPMLKEVITHPNAKFIEQAAINTLGYSMFFELGDRLFKDRHAAQEKAKAAQEGKAPTAVGLPAPEKKHFGFFTNEASIGRFVFRRMVPTAVGITAYTAFKFRHAYMVLGDLQVVAKDAAGVEKKILPQIPKLIRIETAAVLLFAIIPWVAEKWEKAYDNFFAKLEKKTAPSEPPLSAQPAIAAPVAVEPAPAKTAPSPQVMHIVTEGKASVGAPQHHLA